MLPNKYIVVKNGNIERIVTETFCSHVMASFDEYARNNTGYFNRKLKGLFYLEGRPPRSLSSSL